MAQLTVRTGDELVRRVRLAAAAHGSSVNSYIVDVLDAATNPDLADSPGQRLRERLAAAGLLASPTRSGASRPAADRVEAARKAAAAGRPLSDLVDRERG